MPVECLRQSAIVIPEGDAVRVYRSLEQVPRPLRARLSGVQWDYATILIADRRGREEIAKALRGHPSVLRFHSFRQAAQPREVLPDSGRSRLIPGLVAGAVLASLAALAWVLGGR